MWTLINCFPHVAMLKTTGEETQTKMFLCPSHRPQRLWVQQKETCSSESKILIFNFCVRCNACRHIVWGCYAEGDEGKKKKKRNCSWRWEQVTMVSFNMVQLKGAGVVEPRLALTVQLCDPGRLSRETPEPRRLTEDSPRQHSYNAVWHRLTSETRLQSESSWPASKWCMDICQGRR